MQPLPGVPDLRVRWFQGRIVSILLGTDQDWSAGSDDLSAAGAKLPNLRGIRLGDTGATVRNIIPQGTNFRILAAGISNYTIATRGGATLTMVGAGAPPLQNPDGPPDSSLVRGFELTDSTKVQYPWGDPVSSASPIPAPVTPGTEVGREHHVRLREAAADPGRILRLGKGRGLEPVPADPTAGRQRRGIPARRWKWRCQHPRRPAGRRRRPDWRRCR